MISNSEWEVMRIIWTLENVGSSEIIKILSEKKQWSPSTIKTLISRLVDKKLISYRKVSNKNIYYSNFTEKDGVFSIISDVLNKVCSKKIPNILEIIVENTEMSKKDIAQLEKILKKKILTAPETVKCNCVAGQCMCK
ncbi:CopY/TcrY family copper transport repressor [Gemelliphila palaticanis]|uniref:CopY/TcrY family copper transport repressor n=1 Tax=Gemelliphila palaticanis TaxID=81950 RepID=A0ABX2T1R5_9BACL|nr:CopY/TcrY family copper transport repressor [Gemella palaticanis]MBF0716191.1 CopY/TcrY family copper transport repressor [Gemella palaticanis]NYS48121.1 CopY/TcrY family copper transport repressor [Gemella palaticanis]